MHRKPTVGSATDIGTGREVGLSLPRDDHFPSAVIFDITPECSHQKAVLDRD